MAMFKNKLISFSLVLVCLVMVSPTANALLGGLLGGGGLGGLLGGGGGLGGLLGGGGGGLGGLLGGGGGGGLGGLLGGGGGGGGGGLGGLLGLIRIQGILRCSVNNNASSPVFPNAAVQLQCGGQNRVVSTTTTTGAGIFSMLINPLDILLTTLLSGCQLAVATPLSTCNASLPSVGQLLSPLNLVGNILNGLLRIVTLGPTGFLLA
ncbi:unnamed protein product [Cochlearia groenlandica]